MLADQIAMLIRSRLLDPVEILFGDAGELPARADDLARELAETIEGDDEQAAVYAIARLVGALYPSDGPFDPPIQWWRTPLGRATAKRMGHPAARAVSYSVAGAMLGVTKQGVFDLVQRGKLTKDADGGVTTDSVKARLNQ